MDYRELTSDDLTEASGLVWNVFAEFVAPEYAEEGVETFRTFTEAQQLTQLLAGGRFFFLGCFDGLKLAGLIAIRDYNHISLLFVGKNYQRRGIAGQLFDKAKDRCLQANPQLREITVNSSPYAAGIYQRLGFKKTGDATVTDGMTFIPMTAVLQDKGGKSY